MTIQQFFYCFLFHWFLFKFFNFRFYFIFNWVYLWNIFDLWTFHCDLFCFSFSYVNEVSCHKLIGLVRDHIFQGICFLRWKRVLMSCDLMVLFLRSFWFCVGSYFFGILNGTFTDHDTKVWFFILNLRMNLWIWNFFGFPSIAINIFFRHCRNLHFHYIVALDCLRLRISVRKGHSQWSFSSQFQRV